MNGALKAAIIRDELAKVGVKTKHQRCLFYTAKLEVELFGRVVSPSVALDLRDILVPQARAKS